MAKHTRVALFEPYCKGLYGNQKYILSLLSESYKFNFNLLLIVPESTEFTAMAEELGAKVVVVPAPKLLQQFGGAILQQGYLKSFLTALAVLAYTAKLVRALKASACDVVLCLSVRSMSSVGIASFLLRKPRLLYVKGELTTPIIDVLCFFMANRIAFQSIKNLRCCKRIFRKLFIHKMRLVPNGINLTEAENILLDTESHAGRDEQSVISVGRIEPEKGTDVCVGALIKLSKLLPNLKFTFVGEVFSAKNQKFYDDLLIRIQSHGLSNRVAFLGWRSDVLRLLANSDLFVLPSRTEGVPKSMLEAMSLGLPVVVSSVGGITSVVRDDHNGIVLHAINPEELAQHILNIFSNKELAIRLGKNARETVIKKFGLDNNLAKLAKVLEEVRTI